MESLQYLGTGRAFEYSEDSCEKISAALFITGGDMRVSVAHPCSSAANLSSSSVFVKEGASISSKDLLTFVIVSRSCPTKNTCLTWI